MFTPFQCIYKLKKVCQPEEETGRPRLSPEEVVDRIFLLVDENGDGEKFAPWVTLMSVFIMFSPARCLMGTLEFRRRTIS